MYEGEWLNDLKHGKGAMTFANGDTYDGEWEEGKYHGQGVFVYDDGSR